MEAKTKGYKRLVGSSGGNAGLAMAYAANQLKMPLTLFIPKVCFSHNQGCLYTYDSGAFQLLTTYERIFLFGHTLLFSIKTVSQNE